MTRLIIARHPELGPMFAAIDPMARFTTPSVSPSKLSAHLAPFPDENAASIALEAAGARIEALGHG